MGLEISKHLKNNLKQLEDATDIDTSFIEVQRFGLEHDYIIENDLIWTDNLMTSGKKDLSNPKHKDHKKDYVQNYIKKYGARKVEANAMIKDIPKARDLLLTTVLSLVSEDDLESYEESLVEPRKELLEEFKNQWSEEV